VLGILIILTFLELEKAKDDKEVEVALGVIVRFEIRWGRIAENADVRRHKVNDRALTYDISSIECAII
jgi:predicted nucleic acid-binding protein